ncbi:MAG: hypothetical protein GXO86_07210 [Chlorobi bacterium]|nr:hypothetical protein [Chlorobiota bacterium]
MSKVKKLVKYIVFTDKNDEVKHQYKSFLQEFDERGNSIREVEYTPDGRVDNAAEYKYDDENRLIEEVHYFEDEVTEKIRYILDEEGKRTGVETTYADDSKSVKKVIREGNTITVKTFDEDGDPEEEDRIKYDEEGRVTEEVKLDEEGKIVNRNVYEYNKNGKLLYKTEYEGEDGAYIKTTLEYDEQDNLISEIQVTDKGNLVSRMSFQYNEQGDRSAWQNNRHVHRVVYDEQRRPVMEETKNRVNNLIENFTEYKYNEQGLVAEERTFSLGGQFEIDAGTFGGKSDFVITRYEYEFFEEK